MPGSLKTVAVASVLLATALLRPTPSIAEEGRVDAAGLAAARLEASRAKLGAGEADKALALAAEALEYTPSDLELLDYASACAEQAQAKDAALWYASLAVLESRMQGANPAQRRAREARVASLDPLAAADRPRLAEYGEQVLDLGRYCVKRKLYANAVDFFERCEGLSSQTKAREALEKLYASKKAIQALLDSGLDVPLRSRRDRRARRLAAQDPKHKLWKDAWKLKGENYTVVTNMGWELGDAVSRAMEQMNRFYRQVFQHKVGGGNTARCTIDLYRTWEVFSRREDEQDPTTQGFFIPGENRVALYDPRVQGYPLMDLWETLFHECSHQFVEMLLTGTPPDWINEGTATYFEGSRLRANGRVECNLVHEGRLKSLKEVIDKGSPTLQQVVSFLSETDSYGLDYYPVGWGLVYFLRNYEDESCERVYEPHYQACLKAYRSGGKHVPVERFVEYFVKKPKQKGIATFADFEKRWRTWILELYDLQFGPPDRADVLRERARRQIAARKLDAAEESLRWALQKRVADFAALFELAGLYDLRKEKDAALTCYRSLLAKLERIEDADTAVAGLEDVTVGSLAETCRKRIRKLDARLLDVLAEAGAELEAQVAKSAAAAAEAGYPRNALFLLDAAVQALGGCTALEAQRRAIADASGVDVWRRQRLVILPDLAVFDPTPKWTVRDGRLRAVADDPATVMVREQPPTRYRFEATFRATSAGEVPLVGLLFGVDDAGDWDVFFQSSDGTRELNRVVVDWEVTEQLKTGRAAGTDPVTLAIEVDGGRVTCFANGEVVGTFEYPVSEIQGRVGIVANECEAECWDVKLGIR